MKNRILTAILLICCASAAWAQPISGTLSLCSGHTTTLTPPAGGGTWSSGATGVATVGESTGIVTGVSAGTAAISYIRPDADPAIAIVSVDPVPSAIGGGLYKLCEGSRITLTNDVAGGTWMSGNTLLGTVHPTSGVVWGRPISSSFGDVPFDVIYTVCSHSVSVTVTLTPLVELTYPSIVCVGQTVTMEADQTGAEWRWHALLVGAATGTIDISTGEFTATAPGIIRIGYARDSTPGCKDSTYSDNIYVMSATGYITGSRPVFPGDTIHLRVPAEYGTWSSSNPSVATVTPAGTKNQTGVITGVSSGTAIITFRQSEGAACYTTTEVTVNASPSAITGTLNACVGQSRTLASATTGGTWGSSNTSVVTVGSASGIATGVAIGTATITYTAPTGCRITAVFTVNAGPAASPYYDTIVCAGGSLRLYAGDGGGNTYAWSGPSSFTSTLRNPTRASVTTTVNGAYSVVVTSTAGCTASYTVSVNILTNPAYAVSVTQLSPMHLAGDKVHTYVSSGFVLQAVTAPALPAGATYTWTGPVAGAASTFSPSFTAIATVSLKLYTVTVAYNGCSSSVKDTILVPKSGACSPYDYFSVNGYRSRKSLGALAGCTDCSDIKPFHTVVSGVFAGNIADSQNYYVPYSVFCNKATLSHDNFFMGEGTYVHMDSTRSVTINHCHFYSCGWMGIVEHQGVDTTAHLTITGSSLIENTSGTYMGKFTGGVLVWKTKAGGYYYHGMADVLRSDGAIYNKNDWGIAINDYRPSLAKTSAGTRLPFTITNSIFTNKEFAMNDNGATAAANYPFAWPSVSALKTVVSGGDVPKFALNNYRTAAPNGGGILVDNVGSASLLSAGDANTPATYEYNYMHIGDSSADPTAANANLYDSIYVGIQTLSTNVALYNNTFRNLRQHGYEAFYSSGDNSSVHDIRIQGSRDTLRNTNNRFYHCGSGIYLDGSYPTDHFWDFSCSEAVFSGSATTGMVTSGFATYVLGDGAHNSFNFYDNYIYRYGTGLSLWYTSGSVAHRGNARIYRNEIIGKNDSGSSASMHHGIVVFDTNPNVNGKGTIRVDSNHITGAVFGITASGVRSALYVNDNVVQSLPYPIPSGGNLRIAGYNFNAAYNLKEVQRNKVTGIGYACVAPNSVPFSGFYIQSSGASASPASVSCNLAQDINTGFEFANQSYVSFTRNEMRRNKWGLFLGGAIIGDQGSPCSPSDNRWTSSVCESDPLCGPCSDFPGWGVGVVKATYTALSNPSYSKLYVRNETDYVPVGNFNSGGNGGTPGPSVYDFSNGSLINCTTACGSTLPEADDCGPGTGERGVAYGSSPASAVASDAAGMRIFPNPADGNVTVELPATPAGTVSIHVVNAVGAEVYNHTHTFSGSRTNLDLQQLTPGIYIVYLDAGTGVRQAARLVIMK